MRLTLWKGTFSAFWFLPKAYFCLLLFPFSPVIPLKHEWVDLCVLDIIDQTLDMWELHLPWSTQHHTPIVGCICSRVNRVNNSFVYATNSGLRSVIASMKFFLFYVLIWSNLSTRNSHICCSSTVLFLCRPVKKKTKLYQQYIYSISIKQLQVRSRCFMVWWGEKNRSADSNEIPFYILLIKAH